MEEIFKNITQKLKVLFEDETFQSEALGEAFHRKIRQIDKIFDVDTSKLNDVDKIYIKRLISDEKNVTNEIVLGFSQGNEEFRNSASEMADNMIDRFEKEAELAKGLDVKQGIKNLKDALELMYREVTSGKPENEVLDIRRFPDLKIEDIRTLINMKRESDSLTSPLRIKQWVDFKTGEVENTSVEVASNEIEVLIREKYDAISNCPLDKFESLKKIVQDFANGGFTADEIKKIKGMAEEECYHGYNVHFGGRNFQTASVTEYGSEKFNKKQKTETLGKDGWVKN